MHFCFILNQHKNEQGYFYKAEERTDTLSPDWDESL